jgi:hypothetical protein
MNTSANCAGRKLLGDVHGRVIGRPLATHVVPEARREFRSMLNRIATTQGTSPGQHRHRRRQGSRAGGGVGEPR